MGRIGNREVMRTGGGMDRGCEPARENEGQRGRSPRQQTIEIQGSADTELVAETKWPAKKSKKGSS